MSDYPSSYEAPDPANNAFDGWYHNQIQLSATGQQQQQQQAAKSEETSHEQQQGADGSSPAPLPEGWEEMRDPQSGRAYYVDHANQVTTWDRPSIDAVAPGNATGAAGEDANELKQASEVDNNEDAEETRVHEWNYPSESVDDADVGGEEATAQMPALGESHEQHHEQEGAERQVASPMNSRTRQFAEKWDKSIAELIAWKEKHGTVNVPQKEGPLGRWVNNQRQFYKQRMNGGKSCLTDDRIAQLEELGFVWSTKKGKQQSTKKSEKLEKKAPKTTRKRRKPPVSPIKSKKPNASTWNNVSTKRREDGTQVVITEERITHSDGSKVDIETEEAINKRTIRMADGTRVLETTTKIATTKIERIVLPSNIEKEKESQTSEGGDTMPPEEEKPAAESAPMKTEETAEAASSPAHDVEAGTCEV